MSQEQAIITRDKLLHESFDIGTSELNAGVATVDENKVRWSMPARGIYDPGLQLTLVFIPLRANQLEFPDLIVSKIDLLDTDGEAYDSFVVVRDGDPDFFGQTGNEAVARPFYDSLKAYTLHPHDVCLSGLAARGGADASIVTVTPLFSGYAERLAQRPAGDR